MRLTSRLEGALHLRAQFFAREAIGGGGGILQLVGTWSL